MPGRQKGLGRVLAQRGRPESGGFGTGKPHPFRVTERSGPKGER
jgi:hypothetical protein